MQNFSCINFIFLQSEPIAMEGIKKKLSNLKLQVDEAKDREAELTKEKKEVEARLEEVKNSAGIVWSSPD